MKQRNETENQLGESIIYSKMYFYKKKQVGNRLKTYIH